MTQFLGSMDVLDRLACLRLGNFIEGIAVPASVLSRKID